MSDMDIHNLAIIVGRSITCGYCSFNDFVDIGGKYSSTPRCAN
ncbi:hypothetical protein GJ496_006039, partial [Pomphorhynchus laevis]